MDAKTYYHRELKKYNDDPDDLRSPDEFSIDCMISFAKEVNGRLLPAPKSGQRLSQIDAFYLITAEKNWYKGIFTKDNAWHWKRLFLAGKLGTRRIEKVFCRFGFSKHEVIWIKKSK